MSRPHPDSDDFAARLDALREVPPHALEAPALLFERAQRRIHWLGAPDQDAFRANTYLITDGDAGVLVDPGPAHGFEATRRATERALDGGALVGVVVCHQDPDVAGSIAAWVEYAPDVQVITSPRTKVLLPHYGLKDYRYHDITSGPFPLGGAPLRFVEAPFLHFPGAFATYEPVSRSLLSGDVWAALDTDPRMVVSDFEAHAQKLDLFHLDYMACNLAARGFVARLADLEIHAILPQHGSIVARPEVPAALDYLEHLECGVDLVYAGLAPR